MIKSGFINVIKPTGVSSSHVVCYVKRTLKLNKVGHLGTLDPAASGVLPIAFGKATKFFDYFLSKDKVYVADVKFGVLTDTLDSFGELVKSEDVCIEEDEIKKILPEFIGKIQQVPPMFSAIKIAGKKACDLAREGKSVKLAPREIEIFSIELLGKIDRNLFRFRVHCSAGTYIRTLFSDIAERLDTIATTPVIIREKSGVFEINNAVTMNELDNVAKIYSINEIFSDFECFEVSDDGTLRKLLNGVKLKKRELDIKPNKNQQFFLKTRDSLIGMYHYEEENLVCDVFLYE